MVFSLVLSCPRKRLEYEEADLWSDLLKSSEEEAAQPALSSERLSSLE